MAVDPARAKSLFLTASDLADPAERAAYLDRECAGDAELRARVEALLRANDADPLPEPDRTNTTESFTSEAPGVVSTTDAPSNGEQAGSVIAGKYTLVEVIGEGGMGAVWRARQSEPVKRFVAVKLIRAGMDSRRVLARFEAERQALALMDHPNIAKVFDGGVHEHRPFFVMELVKGVPITDYCDSRRLTPRERLELFVPVCNAIQHAHQKGIIHRDIKPSNVLIALYDDRPVVKVIDFGVAKATGGTLTEATVDTGFGGVVGTPQYMSPEQATFNNLDIDTRSDVYALGVLLYELLTGSPPFALAELEQRGLLEMLRVVREEEPPRPSTKLSTADALPTLSANRGTEPKKLTGLLRDELDWIVMKALEKDRTRRYETANGFAADVLRYLSGEALQAHPPSRIYRLKKFVRRNKPQVIAASLVLLALLAGIAGTTWGLIEAKLSAEAERLAKQDAEKRRGEAEQEKQIAEAVRNFLQNKLLGQADVKAQANALLKSGKPAAQVTRNPTILELLDRAAAELTEERIGQNFPNQPLVQAQILLTVGNAYLAIGEREKAIKFLERSTTLRKQELGPDHPDTLSSRNDLGWAQVNAGYLGQGIPRLEETLALRKSTLGVDNPDTLTSMERLASAYVADSEPNRALSIAEEALRRRKSRLGPHDRDTVESMRNLAETLCATGNPGRALPLAKEAFDLQGKNLGPAHPDTLLCMTTVAQVYRQLVETSQAQPLFEQALTRARENYGPDHPETLQYMLLLAESLPFTVPPGSRFPAPDPRGLKLVTEALALARKRFGPRHREVIPYLEGVAYAHIKVDEFEKALPFFEEAFEIAQKNFDVDNARMLSAQFDFAYGLHQTGDMDRSLPLYEEVLKRTGEKFGADNPFTMSIKENLAEAYFKAGKEDQYREQMEQVFEWRERRLKELKLELGPEHLDTLKSIDVLCFVYMRNGKPERAVPHLREVLEIRKRTLDPDDPNIFLTADDYAHACFMAGSSMRLGGRPKDAVPFLEEAVAAFRKIDPKHPDLPRCQTELAIAHVMSEPLDKALKLPRGPHAAFLLAVEFAWRGKDREASEIAAGLLKSAEGSNDAVVCDRAAKACCIAPADPAQLADALKLARKATETKGKKADTFQLTLGMVEYHNGNLEAAFKTLKALADRVKDGRITGPATYYMAMVRFKEGKLDEAREIATAAAAKMKPIPKGIENLVIGDANLNDVILWLMYKRAKKLIGFKDLPPPTPPEGKETKKPAMPPPGG